MNKFQKRAARNRSMGATVNQTSARNNFRVAYQTSKDPAKAERAEQVALKAGCTQEELDAITDEVDAQDAG
tara:strand:- start:13 stop:225 length:213 start_codon:yes stop_codon:yes gene_type:complete